MENRNLVVGLVIVVLATVIAGVAFLGSEERANPDATSSARVELEAILGELKRNWKSGPRSEIFRKAADRIDELRTPLVDLLSTPPHPLLKEAVELASALEVADAQPPIVDLAEAGPEPVRPAAILAGERLGPWSRDELAHFLTGGPSPVLMATLEVSASRSDRPLTPIVQLLGHEHRAVREAAMNALRENRDAVLVQAKDFEAARQVVFPSVDDETEKLYTRLGEELRRRAVRRREEVPTIYR